MKAFLSRINIARRYAIIRESDNHIFVPATNWWVPIGQKTDKELKEYFHYSKKQAQHVHKILDSQTKHKTVIRKLK